MRLKPFAAFAGYRTAWLGGDLVAGIMLAAIALPEQLATAKLAGFPVEAGLVAFAAGTVAFAVLGTNRFLSVGADSTTASIFAASLGALAATGGAAYRGLAGELALGVGAILVAVGLLRAGWVADLLSIPVTTGILAGIAVHIIAGQLPSLLGTETPSGPLLARVVRIAADASHANAYDLALGLVVLLVTLAAARVSERLPGPLIGLAGAGIAVAAFDLPARGVAVVGRLDLTPSALRLPPLGTGAELAALAPLALVVATVCVLQTSVVVRSFPSDPDVPDDISSDFIAIGLGGMLAGLGGAFPVNSSPPRTAIVQASGGRSQLCGLVALAVLAVLVAFCSRATQDVPQAALAGILVVIGLRLVRLRDILRIARNSRREIQLVIAAALLVIVLPIATGMLLAIMLSLAHGVSLVMWPPATQLFQIRGSTVWWPPSGEREVVEVPGIFVFSPAAPVNFTNAEFIRRRLFGLLAQARAPVTLVVIEASGVTDIDYTGSQMLQSAIATLRSRRIDVTLARLIGPHAQQAARRSGLIAMLGADHVFPSVQEALAARTAVSAKPLQG